MISQCAEFLLEEMVDVNLEEVQVGTLPMVMAAFGKRVKENKKRDSESLLEKVVKGASVRLAENIPEVGLFKGDTGVVMRVTTTPLVTKL